MDNSSIFIVGANGQLGLALQKQYPGAQSAGSNELDITDSASVETYNWTGIKTILNAAGYTNVDGAETVEGRIAAWRVNANAVANLVRIAQKYDITLVHISTDYVFDGTQNPHTETEPLSPLGVYAQSKAAGDIVASLASKHYILRTSWVIGDGNNFVRTMIGLGEKGVSPSVVSDQIGRLTFTEELARAIDHLLTSLSPYGIYNVSNDGGTASWADITREIFKFGGFDLTVTNTTTAEYFASKPEAAPRPLLSVLDLTKLQATGFKSVDWLDDLKTYVEKELAK